MTENTFARAFRVGIAGPVGSGKTALVDCLSKRLWPTYNLAVVTNDIYTKEDAEFLLRAGTLPGERIRGVETGGCPHAAIREDATMNLKAIADLEGVVKWLEEDVKKPADQRRSIIDAHAPYVGQAHNHDHNHEHQIVSHTHPH